MLVSPEGFEPPTLRFEVVHMDYWPLLCGREKHCLIRNAVFFNVKCHPLISCTIGRNSAINSLMVDISFLIMLACIQILKCHKSTKDLLMRRTLFWFLIATTLLLLPCIAIALTPINTITFPDANFRAAVLTNYSDGSGNVDESVTFINVISQNIAGLTGLEYYTSLEQLYCSNNLLTSLDVSSNTALKLLSCGTNEISVLDLSHNPSLATLKLHGK